MNTAKEKGQMKRLFAIFLLILVLLGRIGEKEIFASENVSIDINDTENGDGSTSGSESDEDGSIPDNGAGEDGSTSDSESDGDGSVSDNELASVNETAINGKIMIRVIHDFDEGGAEIVLLKGDTVVRSIRIGTASGSFEYDLDSEEYDKFYIKKADDPKVGNTTVQISTEDLKGKKAVYGSSLAVQPGGWKGDNDVRSVNYGVPIYIKHDFKDGATVCYVKDGADVPVADGGKQDLPSNNIVLFDLESTKYDGFYIEEKGTTDIANTTVSLSRKTIEDAHKAALASSGGTMLTAVVSGSYVSVIKRTFALLPPVISTADKSPDIPEYEYKKEDGIWYVNSTFYDYYSDVELEGRNRKTLSGDMGANGGPNKLQAKKFNSAVSAYFQNTSLANSSWQSPLYFGEFFEANTNGLVNFKFKNNNGSDNGGARLGLVNSKLVNHKLMMGTDNDKKGVEAPYFSKEFLRGNNSLGENIGYVFENISFPFVKDTDTGYWEFDSYDANQTLRMKQTAEGKYFLDRVGASNAVHGHTSTSETAKSNFFPFNDHDQSGKAIQLNYAFGVKLEIPFNMTPNGKVKVKKGDKIEEKEIEFNFEGDDDIWVFIDDELVLDIGGDHGAVKGSINFATCKATTTGCRTKDGTYENVEKGTFETDFKQLDSKKQHVLTLYYMERGLWESNMFISFNFPKTNNLEIEKEVVTTGKDGESLVNEEFADAMETLRTDTSFPISIKNMVTSGLAYSVETAAQALKWSFDSITGDTSVGQFGQQADGAVLQLMTADIPGNNGSRDCVLKYRYPGEKKYTDGQDVTDKRSFMIENRGMGSLDASSAERVKRDGYLELDAYLEAVTGAGAPFVALIDEAGNRVGTWANESAVAGSRGLMQAKKWVTLRIYMSQLQKMDRLDGSESGEFQYTDIKSLQFAYWDDKPVYIDNVTVNAPAVYQVDTGFEKEQNMIPDYGSYASRGPEPISGAKYSMDGKDYYVESGYIYLENAQSAMFSDQFRRNSYLSINEECDTEVFDVAWTLSESGKIVLQGSGTDVEDKRERDPKLTDPTDIRKPPVNTMLFQTYEDGAGDMQYFDLKLKYTNTIKTGSLEIKKRVKVSESSLIDQKNLIDVTIPYTIRVTFSNVAGMYLEGSVNDYGEYESSQEVVIEQDVFLEEGKSVFTITGIPAGTEYRIEEIETAGNDFPLQEAGLTRDDFFLSDMYKESGGNDEGEYDRDKKCYRGTITADENEEIQDKIVIVNDINPVIGKTKMSGQKRWELGDQNADLGTAPQAQSVTLKIQRRFLQSEGDKTNNVTYKFQDVTDDKGAVVEIILKPPDPENPNSESRTVLCADGNEITIETEGWTYSVEGLPLYGKTEAGKRRKYEYRFVETKIVTATKIVTGTSEVNEFTVESEEDASGNLSYKGNQSGYQASSGIVSVAESDEGEQIDYDVTNIYDPLTDLKVIKVSGNDPDKIMVGVTLRLERYVKTSGDGLKKDQNFGDGKGFLEMITGAEGEVIFPNLPDGNYELTETRTIDQYNLLAKPIKLVINRAGESTAEGLEDALVLKQDGNGKVFITLKISNQGLLELPLTGGAPMLYILGLEFISLAGCGLYFGSRYHRKKKPKEKKERKKKEQKGSEGKKRERKGSEQKRRERKVRKRKSRELKNRKQKRGKRKRGK